MDFRAIAIGGAVMAMLQTSPAPRVVATGAQSRIAEPRQVVIRTAAEWSALWHDHQPAAAEPSIDFTRETVVAVFGGTRPTSGYGITIVSAADEGAVLRVRYRETSPPPDAMTAQILTYPFQIVAIPKSTLTDVKFERTQ